MGARDVNADDGRMVPPAIEHRVLVVEDHQDCLETMVRMLSLQGFSVRGVAAGRDALACVAAWEPHTIFLDIGLPDMNGADVALQVRGVTGDQRPMIVAVSGWSPDHIRDRTDLTAFDVFMQKPVSWVELAALLQRQVAQRVPAPRRVGRSSCG